MFYTNNRFNNMAEIDVEPDMNYAHENGALVAMINGYENERALFEAAIYTDIQEATMISEGANDEELFALQENAVTSFFAKIKEFFKKLWEKIKAVFHGFVARFDAFFMKGDKLVKKYRTELMKKNLKDVEVPFEKPLQSWTNPIPEPGNSGELTIDAGTIPSALQNALENWDQDDEVCTYLINLVGGDFKCSDPSDFDEDFHEWLFDDKDDVDAEDIKINVLNFLENKDAIKCVEKINKALDKTFNNIMKDIAKDEKDINSKIKNKTDSFEVHSKYTAKANISGKESSAGEVKAGDHEVYKNGKTGNYNFNANTDANIPDEHKDDITNVGRSMSLIRKKSGALQSALSKYTSACLKEIKGFTSQCKSTLARMVAAKEESTFVDALEDAVLYETDLELRYGVSVY